MKKLFNNKIVIVLTVTMLLLGASCKKLIEVPASPPGQINETKVFSDSLTTIAAVAGVYNYDTGTGTGFAFSDNSLAKYTGMTADELSTTETYSTETEEFYNNALVSRNSNLDQIWGNYYKSIYQINAILAGVNSSTGLSASLKKQLTGEMEVTRALYYFSLVSLYGGVPVVTNTDYKLTSQQLRAIADSVYKKVISDLTDAQSKLTENYPGAGHVRPNKYVSESLLAKVYLTQQNWQLAYNAANDVIQSGSYSLENDLNAVFLDGSQEAIWQLPCLTKFSETQDAVDFVPFPGTEPNFPVSQYLLQAFDANDGRLAKWIGQTQYDDGSGNGPVTFYYPNKYKNTTPPFATIEDFMVLRLAEQYLIRAECAARLGMNTPQALADINMVRTRAGLNSITFTSQQNLINMILQERQRELFCEWGNRLIDLKRTQTINTVLGTEKPGWQSFKAIYPIPFTEIQANSKLTQNPQY